MEYKDKIVIITNATELFIIDFLSLFKKSK